MAARAHWKIFPSQIPLCHSYLEVVFVFKLFISSTFLLPLLYLKLSPGHRRSRLYLVVTAPCTEGRTRFIEVRCTCSFVVRGLFRIRSISQPHVALYPYVQPYFCSALDPRLLLWLWPADSVCQSCHRATSCLKKSFKVQIYLKNIRFYLYLFSFILRAVTSGVYVPPATGVSPQNAAAVATPVAALDFKLAISPDLIYLVSRSARLSFCSFLRVNIAVSIV